MGSVPAIDMMEKETCVAKPRPQSEAWFKGA